MPITIRKHLLSPGQYHVRDRETGQVVIVTFTDDDCRRFAETGNALLSHGFGIPIPLEHQDEAGPLDEASRAARSVSHNTGWTDRFEVDPDNSLWAHLSISWLPDTTEDQLEEALKTRIKYVSPELYPELTLGDGTTWKHVVRHIALTPQPIYLGQKPFGTDGAAALSMRGQGQSWGGPVRLSMANLVNSDSPQKQVISEDEQDEGDEEEDTYDPEREEDEQERALYFARGLNEDEAAGETIEDTHLAEIRGELHDSAYTVWRNPRTKRWQAIHLADYLHQRGQGVRMAQGSQDDPWQPYTAVRGARKGQQVGWKNTQTGRIVYQAHKPGSKMAARREAAAAKRQAKPKADPAQATQKRAANRQQKAAQNMDRLRQMFAEGHSADDLIGHAKALTNAQLQEIVGGLGVKIRKSATKGQLLEAFGGALRQAMGGTAKPEPEPAAAKPEAEKPSPRASFRAEDHTKPLADIVSQSGGDKGGLASLADVRDGLAKRGVTDRKQQDAVIEKARQEGLITGSAPEGRHGLSKRDREAVFDDGDHGIGFLSVRQAQGAPAKSLPGGGSSRDSARKVAHDLVDTYDTLRRFRQYREGMVETHVLYDYLKDTNPSLTPDQFKKTLIDLERSKSVELHVRNEVNQLNKDQQDVTPMRHDKAYGYVFIPGLVKESQTPDDVKRSVKLSLASTSLYPRQSGAQAFQPVRLSRGNDMANDNDNDDLFTEEELEGTEDNDAVDTDGGNKIQDAITELADLGIVVEESDSAESFLEHLCTALKTHKATKSLSDPGDMADQAQPEPEMVAMSMKNPVFKRITTRLADKEYADIRTRVDRLQRAGVLDAATAQQMRETVKGHRLSLVTGPTRDVQRVLDQLEIAEKVGAKQVRMSLAREEQAPSWASWDAPDKEDRKSQEETGDTLADLAGAPRRAK